VKYFYTAVRLSVHLKHFVAAILSGRF